MFNIVFSVKVINDIDLFIGAYRKIFLDRFIDTGIFNEDLIRNNYIELSKEFRNNIYNEIEIRLKEDLILGKMIIDKTYFSVFVTVGNYRILLFYTESIENKIRFVKKITFYKK